MGVFPGKCGRTTAKTMAMDRKKPESTSSAFSLAAGPLPNAANSNDVPTEFAAEHNKDEVLEGKFRNLNVPPSTKKTTE